MKNRVNDNQNQLKLKGYEFELKTYRRYNYITIFHLHSKDGRRMGVIIHIGTIQLSRHDSHRKNFKKVIKNYCSFDVGTKPSRWLDA